MNLGTADLTSSTIGNNNATIQGGGIRNDGPMTLSNITVSGNSATNSGGGILNLGTADITNSTISGNNAGVSRGGIFNFHTVTLTNTAIAGNASPGFPDCDGFTSLGHNLIGTSDGCNFSPATGDLVNVDPMLAPLQDNGGPTFTHALIEGSPAIDVGDNSAAPDTDQRGVPRPLDGDADGTATSDIGAYEFVSPLAARIDAAVTGDEGASITFDGIRSTRGLRAIVSYDWDFGDGQTATFVWGEHIYSDDGIYTITLTVTDDLGTTATAAHQINISNVAPTITSVTTGPANEGVPTTITVTATDPGVNDPLQYFFDCDGNNIFEIGPQTGDNTASCTFPDGPASPTVNVRVDDGEAGVANDSVVVTVNNVDPIIVSVTAEPDILDAQGGVSTITVVATDVPADTLTYSFDCDGNNVFEIGPQAAEFADCNFPAGTNTDTVNVRVEDEDGGLSTDSEQVLVGLDPDNWIAQIFVEQLVGLGVDFGPRTFGVHPSCTSSYDLGFADAVPCDAGRSVFSDPEFKSFFHYPQNSDLAPSQDETRLLTSRIEPADPAENVLHWRFRVELERTAGRENQDDEIVLTWDISTIPPEYQTALLIDHNTLPANQVINMGRVGEYRFTAPAGVESFTRDLIVVVTRPQVQVIPLVRDLNVVSLTLEPLDRNRAAIFRVNETFFSDPDTTAFIRDVAIWFTNPDRALGQRSAGIFPIDFLEAPFVPFSGEIVPGLGHLVDVAFNDAVVIVPGTPLTELEDNARGP